MNSRELRDPLAAQPRWKRRIVVALGTLPILAVILCMGVRAGWRLVRTEVEIELYDMRRLWW